MPYSYRRTNKGYTVFNKQTGKVVGHTTKGKLKKYLAALHIHAEQQSNISLVTILEQLVGEVSPMDRAYQIWPWLKERGFKDASSKMRFFLSKKGILADAHPKLARVSVSSIKPSQFGEDYLNSSSRETAKMYKWLLSTKLSADQIKEGPWRNQDLYPILVNKNTKQIIDGNHRHCAHKLVGARYIYVVYVDTP